MIVEIQLTNFLFQSSYERAKNLLKTYSKEHKLLADALLTYETLDAKEIQMILEGKSLEPRWLNLGLTETFQGTILQLTCKYKHL